SGPDSSVQFFVYQAGAGCQFNLPPSPLSATSEGQYTYLLLTQSSPLCAAFKAQSNASWLQLFGATSGVGAPSIPYRILNNSGSSRSGMLTVENQTFTVMQDPSPV